MTSHAPAISVRNLGKRYKLGQLSGADTFRDAIAGFFERGSPPGDENNEGHLWAIRDITFDVQPGEVLGIIGHNGAGKSTLLKILSRITDPTEGEVEIRGRVSSLLEVGTGFNDELTGRENIILNGSILGMRKKEIDSKFDEIIAFSGVEKFLDTPVKRYSSGMKVRLAFAVAAHLEPEILIIDEVLAVGDAEFQRRCLGKMEDVATSGRTVLFVSHNMAAVEGLCSRAILLRGGRNIDDGRPEQVIGNYLAGEEKNRSEEREGWLADDAVASLKVIEDLKITDVAGGALERIKTGSDFEVRMAVAAASLAHLRVIVSFFDMTATRVTTLESSFQYPRRFDTDRRSEIRCRVNNFRLAPGNYKVFVSVRDGTTVIGGAYLSRLLEVADTDLYGTGRLPPTKAGVYFPEVAWDQTMTEAAPAEG